MIQSRQTLVLAIDGGGTRCRIAACRGGDVVAVETGSANVSTDFDLAVRQITKGLEALAARMGCSVGVLKEAPAYVGLAGVAGRQIADRLRAALPFGRARVEDDRPAAVRGVLGRRDGALAHCGTGSFYAVQIGGAVRLAGGWGPILGDEASAQWVGRSALSLTLEVLDGRQGGTGLSDRLTGQFGGSAGIVRFAGAAQPWEFGALAPLVTNAAEQGDALAVSILRDGVADIARSLQRLGWQPGQIVCLTGGIGPHYGPFLPDDLRAGLAAPEGQPLDGAIALAQDLAEEIAR